MPPCTADLASGLMVKGALQQADASECNREADGKMHEVCR